MAQNLLVIFLNFYYRFLFLFLFLFCFIFQFQFHFEFEFEIDCNLFCVYSTETVIFLHHYTPKFSQFLPSNRLETIPLPSTPISVIYSALKDFPFSSDLLSKYTMRALLYFIIIDICIIILVCN